MYVAHNAFYLACILRGCDMSTVFLYEYMDIDMDAFGFYSYSYLSERSIYVHRVPKKYITYFLQYM